MPELPEVETVRRGLNLYLYQNSYRLMAIRRSRKALRFAFPGRVLAALKGRELKTVERRAKYLLFDFGDKVLLNHLGMTGSWRLSSDAVLGSHDHVILSFAPDAHLIFKDPRRFGYFDLLDKSDWQNSRWFSHLGPEPLDAKAFSVEYLFQKTRKKTAPIKNFIMDQKLVVGVGNIYASEALFHSHIRPTRKAGSLSREEVKKLVSAVRKVLKASIKAGGSSIRDFVGADGHQGYFARTFKVYGREGQLCLNCHSPILQKRLGGRSSFWCSECQF